jgi:poly(A) polymerase
MGRLVQLEDGQPPRWQRRLAVLGWRPGWADALRLSRADVRALEATAAALAAGEPPAAAAHRHGADAARDAALVSAAHRGASAPATLEAEIARGAAVRFPLRAADLDLAGPALGAALRRLERIWIDSDFALSADELRLIDLGSRD